jgi:hypothetical protein
MKATQDAADLLDGMPMGEVVILYLRGGQILRGVLKEIGSKVVILEEDSIPGAVFKTRVRRRRIDAWR